MSSLGSTEVLAAESDHLVHQHWAPENGLHHVLDAAPGEDAGRIRRNPAVFACLRQLALNLLHANVERTSRRPCGAMRSR